MTLNNRNGFIGDYNQTHVYNRLMAGRHPSLAELKAQMRNDLTKIKLLH